VADQTDEIVDLSVRQGLVGTHEHGHLNGSRKRQDVFDSGLRTGHEPVDGVDEGAVFGRFLSALFEWR